LHSLNKWVFYQNKKPCYFQVSGHPPKNALSQRHHPANCFILLG
jgi:hypothetical protein